MPEITITLTETEACHIRELVQEDQQVNERATRFFPNDCDFNKVMAELDTGILEKLKDA
jgi:hypothetical protein